MKVVKVLLLLIILMVLTAGLTVGQSGLAVWTMVLRTDFYADVLRGHGVYESLPGLVLAALPAAEDLPVSERVKIEAALREALDPEWLDAQVKEILRDVSLYLRGRSPVLTASVPLGEFRDRFIESYARTGHPAVVKELRQTLAQAPSEMPLADQVPPEVAAAVARYSGLAGTVTLAAAAVWLILAVLCFPLAGGFPGGARWVGTAFLLSGLGTLAATFAAGILLTGLIAGFGLGGFEGVPVREMTTSVARGALSVARTIAFVSCGIAVVLYVAAGAVARGRARRAAAGAAGPGGPAGSANAGGPAASPDPGGPAPAAGGTISGDRDAGISPGS
ncbi:MAG: hypothetical protein AB1645_00675 [Bacillota bacterium]|jgi:hypothetical protein